MDSNNRIKVVLVDDQPIIVQGLKYIIDSQPDMKVIGDANDSKTAIDVILASKPDIVLMDIQMPNGTGIEATHRILSLLPSIKVILLTTFDVQEYVFDGIRAGASGYLLKDADTQELLDGIHGVYQGEALYKTPSASKALAKVISDGVNTSANPNIPLQINDPLTDRELDVLQQMAYGRRNTEISEILHISQGTVKTHVHRILQKLGVEERTQAVVIAIRQGLVK